ncbi:hypothetical protein B0H12DRAFT_134865 [Mycena haematopus]|nr:hypothetical protein B0H12DRAFT_134865 [Mycena haematopus]
MHRCLSIAEIVGNICEHLNGISRGARSLAALARTCRNFHDPALDCLWAVQYNGLMNLLRCMPSDLFEFSHGGVRLMRPVLKTDWERPLVYMPRIRYMIVKADPSIPNIFPALSASLPGDLASWFPRLRSLQWLHRKDFFCIRMLLSPRLTFLHISMDPSNANFSLLSSISWKCPALKNFSVQVIGTIQDGRSALSSCLRDLHSLESAHVHIPDLAALEHLSQLRGLTVLITSLPDDLCSDSPFPLPFIALERLIIRSEIEPTTSFFRRCCGAPLKDIAIILNSCSTTSTLTKLHTALRDGCSHTSLLSLRIENQEYDLPEPGNDAYTIDIHSICLLFCFVNITSITMDSYAGFNIDDQGMKELALAWPQIEVLRLRLAPYNDAIRPHPQLSLRCLRSLAEHCQALKELEVSFDAMVIPEPDPNASVRTRCVSQPALRTFNVGKSLISEPTLHVARFISALFPNVSDLRTDRSIADNDDPDELEEHAVAIAHHALWMEVATSLPILTAIRKEERLWAQTQLLETQPSLSLSLS